MQERVLHRNYTSKSQTGAVLELIAHRKHVSSRRVRKVNTGDKTARYVKRMGRKKVIRKVCATQFELPVSITGQIGNMGIIKFVWFDFAGWLVIGSVEKACTMAGIGTNSHTCPRATEGK